MALDKDPGSKADRSQMEWVTVEQKSLLRARQASRSEPVRVWTPIGTVDAGAIADVDPSGLVQMRNATWSLDWWIGAADRWHFPSQEDAVGQRLSGSSPVVETAMHVPGGDIVHRAYGVRGKSVDVDDQLPWDDSAVVVEVENLSAVPVALAFAVLPLVLDGAGSIKELGVEGPTVRVDGRVGAVLSKPVVRRVVGPPGTSSIRIEMTDDEEPEGVWSVDGQMAEGAYVVTLSHTEVVRILLPRAAPASAPRLRRSKAVTEPGSQWDAPGHEPVSSGWATHTRAAAQISTPEKLLAEVASVSERLLLMASSDYFFEGDGVSPTAIRNAELCDALARAGLSEPLGPLARALMGAERLGGAIRMPDRSDATVALVHAAAPLLVGSRSEAWAGDLVGPVAKAIHRLGQGKGLDQGKGLGSESSGFMLRRSAATSLARIAPALRHVGQPEVAEAATEVANKMWSDLVGESESLRELEDSTSGAGDTTMFMRGLKIRAALATRRGGALDDLLGFAARGHLGGLGDREDAEGLPSGAMGMDPAAVAVRLSAILDLLLGEGPSGPVIAPSWPVRWFDRPLEAHSIRTSWGAVSFAIRWHGDRPAVLWEIEPGAGADEATSVPVLTAPGIDPGWTGHGLSGDALLAPVEVPAELREARAKPAAPRTPVQLSVKRKPV